MCIFIIVRLLIAVGKSTIHLFSSLYFFLSATYYAKFPQFFFFLVLWHNIQSWKIPGKLVFEIETSIHRQRETRKQQNTMKMEGNRKMFIYFVNGTKKKIVVRNAILSKLKIEWKKKENWKCVFSFVRLLYVNLL